MPDKLVLITGTSSGFGLLASVEFAQAGFQVVATLRSLDRRQKLDAAASASGVTGKIDVRRLDVTDLPAISTVI